MCACRAAAIARAEFDDRPVHAQRIAVAGAALEDVIGAWVAIVAAHRARLLGSDFTRLAGRDIDHSVAAARRAIRVIGRAAVGWTAFVPVDAGRDDFAYAQRGAALRVSRERRDLARAQGDTCGGRRAALDRIAGLAGTDDSVAANIALAHAGDGVQLYPGGEADTTTPDRTDSTGPHEDGPKPKPHRRPA